MNMTPDLQKKAALVGAFVLVAAGILYYELKDDSPAPVAPVTVTVKAPAATASSGAAKSLGTTSAQLDPTLRMDAMQVTESLVYSGTGRNIFSATSAPAVVMPKPIMPVRVKQQVLPPAPPPGPPPPPPIDLKFFGTATSANGHRQAFLLHGDDVFIASDGDIVQRKYRVLTISANSVVVEDMANNNRQTLPLMMN